MSGSTATISYQPSLYLPVAGDGQLNVWYIHSDGGAPDATGVYNDTISGSYTKELETRSEGFFIPFAALTVTNGHGVYVGAEWSAARTYIQGGSTTHALLEATGYQEGRGFTYALANNAGFAVPPAFVGAYSGDKDDGGNSLRKYLWDYHMPDVIRTNSSYPKVQWNAFTALAKTLGSWDTVQTKWAPFIDAIAPLGFEEVMHDVGWNEGGGQWPSSTSTAYDPVDWPLGMKVSFDYAKSRGLDVGLYLPGPQSYASVKYLFDTYGTQMWRSDATAGNALGSPTATTYADVRNFYQMLDALQADVPGFKWENCHSGGRIKDFGAMQRATKIFLTDAYSLRNVQRAFFDGSFLFPPAQLMGCLLERPTGVTGTVYAWRTAAQGAPEWIVDSPQGLNGGAVWSAAERQALATTIVLYKNRVRPLQRDSDLYHLTARPDGTTWYAFQYYKPSLKQGVVYVFKPQSSLASQVFTLKGLDPATNYVLTFADGSNPTTIRSGAALMSTGIEVALSGQTISEWMFLAPEGVSVNHAPTANSNDYATVKNVSLNVTAPGVLGNDSDPDGDSLIAVLADNPLHGSVTLNADGSFSYTPANNYSGPDAFTYQASDGWATSATATVAITVTWTNYPPAVAIDSPLLGAGAGPIALKATATDDGSVTNVAFYAGANKVGAAALPPFAWRFRVCGGNFY